MAPESKPETTSPTIEGQLPTPPPEMEDITEPGAPPSSTLDSVGNTAQTTNSPVQDKTAATSELGAEGVPKGPDGLNSGSTEVKASESTSQDAAKETPTAETKSTDGQEAGEKTVEAKDSETEKKTTLPRGMKAGTKDLWAKTDAQCKCCTTWVENNPESASENVEESDECLQHAIVVRRKRKHEGNQKPLKVDSIVVHSPLIKRVLQSVFTSYPDLVIDLDELVFDAPFAPFFFRWQQFSKAVQDEEDELTRSHLGLLHGALEKELEKPITRHKDLIRSRAMDFDLLWTLYTPGELMFSHDNGHNRLYEVTDFEYWQDLTGMKLSIRADIIDWDGERFGRSNLTETISKYKGTRSITSLPSYPLQYHPQAAEIKQRCISRGRRFQELAGVFCKDYRGTAVEYTNYNVQMVKNKRHYEGRIMLDEELFAKFNPDEAFNLRELGEDAEELANAEAASLKRLGEKAQIAREALQKAEEAEKKRVAEELAKAEKTNDKTEKSSEDASTTSPSDSPSKATETQVKGETDSPTSVDPGTPSASGEASNVSDAVPNSNDSETLTESAANTPTSSEIEEEEPKAWSSDEKQELTEDQLAICSSWLRGYSLARQKWAAFSVDHILDVTWNEAAFEALTLPEEYRELILATVKSQIRQNKWKKEQDKIEKTQKPLSTASAQTEAPENDSGVVFDDFIAQKGLGYIMLFSGNPGVGKTATAESIAELLHVPLCVISMGTLGTSAESVESALQDVLELAARWQGVLLLDEADVFLEQRTKHDLHRNAVVSVFLRLLESYTGCMCLTTNRAAEIDAAFHSRIHISLPFPDLTEVNREQIWRLMAKITNERQAHRPHSGSDGVSESVSESKEGGGDELVDLSAVDYRKLSQTPLNGRQIKNAFKTAVLLATYKNEKVQLKHVKTALKTIDGNGLGQREVGRMYY